MINFTFKNNSGTEFNSLYDFGIYLSERPTLPRAERNFKFTEVEGKNGTSTIDLKTYKDIEISLSCFVLNSDITNNINDRLNSWLNGEGGILTFSFLFDKYIKVKQVKGYKVKESSGILGEFEVTFICEPFKFLTNGENTITITQPTSIFNEGTFESQPIIKVYGGGNITLTINNKNVILTAIDQSITLDCEIEHAYKDLVVNAQNIKMQGEFPIFNEGQNIISWVGNVNKIEVIPKWRCL